jgi:hypothetical protein
VYNCIHKIDRLISRIEREREREIEGRELEEKRDE